MDFWDETPYSLWNKWQYFRGICYLHLQDYIYPEDGGSRFLLSTKLDNTTPKKTIILVLTAMRTSHLLFLPSSYQILWQLRNQAAQ
jgi:hypothetical protein